MASGYLAVKETSEILGYSEQYICKMLKSEELNGEMIGNRWIIAAESASEYRCKEQTSDTTVPDRARKTDSWKISV